MLKKRLLNNGIVTVTIRKGAYGLIKQIIYKAKMKKWCKALNEFDLTELENKGNYILSLCVDKETGNTFEPIEHHLPLIDTARSEQDINNWDLSENVKNTVKSYQKDLLSYADMVILFWDWTMTDSAIHSQERHGLMTRILMILWLTVNLNFLMKLWAENLN